MSTTLLFICVAHTLHITVVVIGPHQGNVIRHAQTCVVDVERLLVRDKNLLNRMGFPVFIFLEDGALFSHHLLQRAGTDLGVLAALHSLVVQTTHTHGVDIVILGSLADAIIEFLQDRCAVGLIVPLSIARLVPLRRGCIVEQQWLAMAGRNHNAPLVGHLLTLRVTIESPRTGMHSWGEHISF